MQIISLKTCDTCRKAIKALRELHPDLTVTDVRADGVPAVEFERLFGVLGDALINKKSATWRGLDDDVRAQPPVDLLVAHPTLMKRPVIEHSGEITLGWTKDVQAKWVG